MNKKLEENICEEVLFQVPWIKNTKANWTPAVGSIEIKQTKSGILIPLTREMNQQRNYDENLTIDSAGKNK